MITVFLWERFFILVYLVENLNGNMLGTESFPALCVEKICGLPLPNDAFNCSVGMIAAIAIILRNVCVQNPGQQVSFDKQFVLQKEKLLHIDLRSGEWYACFDANFFQPLPTKEELVWDDYLAMKEWVHCV
jgi:hypothetical protein